MKIIFEKTSESAILPTRGTSKSSGLDFYTPKAVSIGPKCDALIALDLKVHIPEGYDLTICNKSGRATKDKLIVGAEIVDQDYTGVIHAHLFNLGERTVVLEKGTKIVQGIVRKVELLEVEEGSIDRETDRGDGGFGSTSLR